MHEARSIICASEPRAEQVMQCLLGIRDLEIEAYFELLKEPATPQDLADRMGRSRSLVQRALQNLVSYGLAHRTSLKKTRGRAYEYSAVSKKETKRILKAAFREWARAVETAIDKL
jgi:predicted transcriptional regulator